MRASLRSLALAGVTAAACTASSRDALRVSVAPTFLLPKALLDNATALTVDVYDATTTGAGCDAKTGLATSVDASTPLVASDALHTDGCGTAKFCGALPITKSTDLLVFAAVATAANGAVVANGCATATVNQDVLDLSIPMVRFVQPATCGNGVVEATEQCDPPGSDADLVCDSKCHTKEVLLSNQGPTPAVPPFFLWPTGSGEAGRFFAFFTDDAGGQKTQVAMRVMSDAFAPFAPPQATSAAILAPNDSTGPFPPAEIKGDQNEAAAAFVSNTYWYAFVDDAQNANDIHLRSFDHQLSALQPAADPISVNGPGGAGEENQQLHPSIAVGPGGKLLVAWQDLNGPFAGQVMARTYDPGTSTLGTQQQISSGAGNQEIQVAATATGWIAVWDDGTQIKLRAIDGNGTPSGGETVVSDGSHSALQDHPGIAVLADGSAAVVWCDHTSAKGGEIFVQRFDPNLTPVSGDQAKAINDVVSTGDQLSPAIAGSAAAGGSYVAAWLDKSTGAIQARALDASGGFLFNPIDGQTTEFTASVTTSATLDDPTVAIGGSGPWVAIGWTKGAAVMGRRFPAPSR